MAATASRTRWSGGGNRQELWVEGASWACLEKQSAANYVLRTGFRMTLNEFKTALRTYRKQELRALLFFMVGMVGLTLPASFIEERAKTMGFDIWCILVAVIGFSLVGGLMFYSAARLPQKCMRRLGLVCPTCQKPLVGITAQIVVATGKCGYCGGQYLSP